MKLDELKKKENFITLPLYFFQPELYEGKERKNSALDIFAKLLYHYLKLRCS